MIETLDQLIYYVADDENISSDLIHPLLLQEMEMWKISAFEPLENNVYRITRESKYKNDFINLEYNLSAGQRLASATGSTTTLRFEFF